MENARWVKDRFYVGIDDEMCVFMRPNSPNYYCRYYVRQEQKYYQKSLRTKSKVVAQEKAKEIYREITTLVSRDEKVFNLTWKEAIDIYDEMEMERYMGGVIVREWYKKKLTYLRNTWMNFVGADTPVNKTNDDDAREFYRIRSRHLKTKTVLRYEITIVNSIYTDLLVPKNYCLRKFRMPKTTITKRDRSRRTDTFTIEEWEVLYKSMQRWTERDEITDERQAQTRYGKTTNMTKKLSISQQELEWCRRNILREFILISANMGTRPVSELLNVKRKDVNITKTKFKDWYAEGNDEWRLTCDVFIDSSGRRKGQQINRFVLNRLFTELMHYAGLTRIKFTPYHLRHFYITQRLMNGVDVVLLSENAGNSPQVLLQSYAHIKTKLATQELNKVRKRSSREELGIDF